MVKRSIILSCRDIWGEPARQTIELFKDKNRRRIGAAFPTILCTGYSKKVSEESARKIGIKAFAYKPIVKADLVRTDRKVLDEVKGSACNSSCRSVANCWKGSQRRDIYGCPELIDLILRQHKASIEHCFIGPCFRIEREASQRNLLKEKWKLSYR